MKTAILTQLHPLATLDSRDMVVLMTIIHPHRGRTSPFQPFIQRSASSLPTRLADRLTDAQKSRVIEALVAKYGSRRALIEELDRRKRLSLLNPDYKINTKGEKGKTPRVPNAPNPQWREITTPSLLIEGERVSDFQNNDSINLKIALTEIDTNGHRRPDQTNCKKCGCDIDDFTPRCSTCTARRYARHRVAMKKAQQEGIIR